MQACKLLARNKLATDEIADAYGVGGPGGRSVRQAKPYARGAGEAEVPAQGQTLGGWVRYAPGGQTASEGTQIGKGDHVLGKRGTPLPAGEWLAAFAEKLRVAIGPRLGVHLVEPESRPAVATLTALAALYLTDRVEDAGVRLGVGSATEQEQGDDGHGAHGRRGMKEPSMVTSAMR